MAAFHAVLVLIPAPAVQLAKAKVNSLLMQKLV
jgi:hypothetical protein